METQVIQQAEAHRATLAELEAAEQAAAAEVVKARAALDKAHAPFEQDALRRQGSRRAKRRVDGRHELAVDVAAKTHREAVAHHKEAVAALERGREKAAHVATDTAAEARAELARLEAAANEAGAAKAEADRAFQDDPSDETATRQLVAGQKYTNALAALNKYREATAELIRAADVEHHRSELAKLRDSAEPSTALAPAKKRFADAIAAFERDIEAAAREFVEAFAAMQRARAKADLHARNSGASKRYPPLDFEDLRVKPTIEGLTVHGRIPGRPEVKPAVSFTIRKELEK